MHDSSLEVQRALASARYRSTMSILPPSMEFPYSQSGDHPSINKGPPSTALRVRRKIPQLREDIQPIESTVPFGCGRVVFVGTGVAQS